MAPREDESGSTYMKFPPLGPWCILNLTDSSASVRSDKGIAAATSDAIAGLDNRFGWLLSNLMLLILLTI
jgi:hypothetical protein